jgi:hypothetical protein
MSLEFISQKKLLPKDGTFKPDECGLRRAVSIA